MKHLLLVILAAAMDGHASAQSVPAPGEAAKPVSASSPSSDSASPPRAASSSAKITAGTNNDSPTTVDRLTRSNQELLDLLNRQQQVLEDIQVDRRLQSRQITLIEQRLEETLHQNASLQAKISRLEAEAAAAPAEKSAAGANNSPATATNAPAAVVVPAPPPPPASYLPPESPGGALGTMWWHRVLSLSGDNMQTSKTFQIEGKQWRVLWHNQDRPGDAYKNTSALFISAFPSNDTIPKRVCSKLGSGGDSTELTGTGGFYLKVEASGGRWELAVEDFR